MGNQIAKRLAEIIEFKTDGKRASFADGLGWSKQYLNKLLNGDSVGLSVITAIVEKYPDIDARWLLTGEGNMVGSAYVIRMLRAWLELEKYIPVMSEGEKIQLSGGRLSWGDDDVARWEKARQDRARDIDERFAASIKKSVKTANKLQV